MTMLTDEILFLLTGKFLITVLIMVRISAFILTSPIFKNEAIPIYHRILLAVILSFIVSSAFWSEQPEINFHLATVVVLVMKEFLAGALIGFTCNVVFWGARFAGGLVDFNLGFQASMVFASQEAPTLFGELYEMMIIMVFLAINGHHLMLEGLFASFRSVPLTTFTVTESTFTQINNIIIDVTVIALKISAPILIAEFLTNLGLALLAKIAPQTNIFMMSFQIKIVVGLLVAFAMISLVVLFGKRLFDTFDFEMMKFIQTLNPIRTP